MEYILCMENTTNVYRNVINFEIVYNLFVNKLTTVTTKLTKFYNYGYIYKSNLKYIRSTRKILEIGMHVNV